MTEILDPGTFGLPPKTLIEKAGRNHLVIVIARKSRIIMSDGKKILEKARKIKSAQPGVRISLRISAPLCSKTKRFLEDSGLEVN